MKFIKKFDLEDATIEEGEVKRFLVGYRDFCSDDNHEVFAQDPCHDSDLKKHSFLTTVSLVPGRYACIADIINTGGWGERVRSIAIIHESKVEANTEYLYDEDDHCVYLGEVGVDAGIAGFFDFAKPTSYSDSEWMTLCNECDTGKAWITDEGFFSESGYGDGVYPLYAFVDESGYFKGLEIEFIDPDED